MTFTRPAEYERTRWNLLTSVRLEAWLMVGTMGKENALLGDINLAPNFWASIFQGSR